LIVFDILDEYKSRAEKSLDNRPDLTENTASTIHPPGRGEAELRKKSRRNGVDLFGLLKSDRDFCFLGPTRAIELSRWI